MNLRHLLRRNNHYIITTFLYPTTTTTTTTTITSSLISTPKISPTPTLLNHTFIKPFHSTPPLSATVTAAAAEDSEDDATMNEFLSRFAHSMRSKLTDSYPNADKSTIDAMLLLVVDKLISELENNNGNFDGISTSEDGLGNEELSRTMWEVSSTVYQEMEREKTKEKLNKYLQCEEVKTLARFASEIGVRGDMLREMRFKWSKEAMEEADFRAELETLKEEENNVAENAIVDGVEGGEGSREEGLPKRKGVIKFKLYGLDLSGDKWREVARKVEESEEVVWPREAKEITGKCKVVTQKIVGMKVDEDEGKVEELVKEWAELMEPSKVDWLALLDNIKARDYSVYLKMSERILDETTFQPDIREYSQLIDVHAKENRAEDVERILKKMSEKGLLPDVLILTSLVHLYSKLNKLDQAKEAFEALKSQGFKPDAKMYNSMIMAYINAGELKIAGDILRKMELRGINAHEETNLALMQAYAKDGDLQGAQRIMDCIKFAGFKPTVESCTLLIQASSNAMAKGGKSTEVRSTFDYMLALGFKPDDRSTSMLISAYEKKNELDKALSLLLQLEKDGFEPGILTYTVLVDWLVKMQLVDEAEQILAKIAQLGEAPPLKLQLSLFDMYVRAGIEKKAFQALGVLEAKRDLLEFPDFERIIEALLESGFENDARRIEKLMETRGFTRSPHLNTLFGATKTFKANATVNNPGNR